jgi:DNA-binding NtrC family response regulator
MPGSQMNLLIVEDEPMARALLAQIFTTMGHSVRSAEDGFSALERIREEMPDILLSDLHMPGMSGFELLSVVRRRLPEIYVIATSGAYSGKSVPEGIAADAFHEKATSVQSLMELMEIASHAEETRQRRQSVVVPIWISHSVGETPVATCLMISCPDCLRTFAEVLRGSEALIYRTECTYCHRAVEYAIVQRLDPGTSQPYGASMVAGAA